MEVETYEVSELTVGNMEELDSEALKIIEESGLTGQQKLIAGSDSEQKIVPYRQMTKEEEFVYENVLPDNESITDFSASPIPVRVLQVYQHAKSLGVFESFRVHHCYGKPDPILTARHSETREKHILARWGEVLVPFEELKKEAVKTHLTKLKLSYEKVLNEIKRDYDIVKDMTEEQAVDLIKTDKLESPHYWSRIS